MKIGRFFLGRPNANSVLSPSAMVLVLFVGQDKHFEDPLNLFEIGGIFIKCLK